MEFVGAVRIKDGLFLGDSLSAWDADFLSSNGIQFVVNCTQQDSFEYGGAQPLRVIQLNWPEDADCTIVQELPRKKRKKASSTSLLLTRRHSSRTGINVRQDQHPGGEHRGADLGRDVDLDRRDGERRDGDLAGDATGDTRTRRRRKKHDPPPPSGSTTITRGTHPPRQVAKVERRLTGPHLTGPRAPPGSNVLPKPSLGPRPVVPRPRDTASPLVLDEESAPEESAADTGGSGTVNDDTIFSNYCSSDAAGVATRDPFSDGLNGASESSSIYEDCLCPSLLKLIRFIDTADRLGVSCLIHSRFGRCRGVMAVCIYLMVRYWWTAQKALEFVLSRRPDLDLRKSFIIQLLLLERLLSTRVTLSCEWASTSDCSSDELLLRNTFRNSLLVPCEEPAQRRRARDGSTTGQRVGSKTRRNNGGRKVRWMLDHPTLHPAHLPLTPRERNDASAHWSVPARSEPTSSKKSSDDLTTEIPLTVHPALRIREMPTSFPARISKARLPGNTTPSNSNTSFNWRLVPLCSTAWSGSTNGLIYDSTSQPQYQYQQQQLPPGDYGPTDHNYVTANSGYNKGYGSIGGGYNHFVGDGQVARSNTMEQYAMDQIYPNTAGILQRIPSAHITNPAVNPAFFTPTINP